MTIDLDLPRVEFVILSEVEDNICVPEFYWDDVIVVPSIGDTIEQTILYECNYYKVVERRFCDEGNKIICFVERL